MIELIKEHYILAFILVVLTLDIIDTIAKAFCAAANAFHKKNKQPNKGK